MKPLLLIAATFLIVCLATAQQPGKPTVRTLQFNAETSVMIRELGAVATEENSKIVVMFVPPKERRPKETADADIESGDEIGMANGKRVATAAELRKLYEGAEKGSEFKLGVRRDGQAHIVTFTKGEAGAMGGQMRIVGDDSMAGLRFLPTIGVGLDMEGKSVVIRRALPNIAEGLKKGDTIESLNGKSIKTIDELEKMFEAAKAGDKLTFGLMRGGKTVEASLPKPEGQAQMRIRTN